MLKKGYSGHCICLANSGVIHLKVVAVIEQHSCICLAKWGVVHQNRMLILKIFAVFALQNGVWSTMCLAIVMMSKNCKDSGVRDPLAYSLWASR